MQLPSLRPAPPLLRHRHSKPCPLPTADVSYRHEQHTPVGQQCPLENALPRARSTVSPFRSPDADPPSNASRSSDATRSPTRAEHAAQTVPLSAQHTAQHSAQPSSKRASKALRKSSEAADIATFSPFLQTVTCKPAAMSAALAAADHYHWNLLHVQLPRGVAATSADAVAAIQAFTAGTAEVVKQSDSIELSMFLHHRPTPRLQAVLLAEAILWNLQQVVASAPPALPDPGQTADSPPNILSTDTGQNIDTAQSIDAAQNIDAARDIAGQYLDPATVAPGPPTSTSPGANNAAETEAGPPEQHSEGKHDTRERMSHQVDGSTRLPTGGFFHEQAGAWNLQKNSDAKTPLPYYTPKAAAGAASCFYFFS